MRRAVHEDGVASPRGARGTAYYVSTGGDDSGPGTPQSPWKNCPGMPGWAGTAALGPGDVVYFDNSDTWSASSGTAVIQAAPGVTYDGSSWGPGARATLRAAGDLTRSVVNLMEDDPEEPTVIRGFEVNAGGHVTSGICVNWPHSSGDMAGALKRIEDCIVHGVVSAQAQGQYEYGIAVSSGYGGGKTTSNVEVVNCTAYDISRGGINIYSANDDPYSRITDVLVRGCEAYQTGMDPDYGGSAFALKNLVINSTFEYNYIHDSNIGIGFGISSHTSDHPGPVNATIRYNVIDHHAHVGMNMMPKAGNTSFDIYGNIISRNTYQNFRFMSGLGGNVTLRLHHNVFYNARTPNPIGWTAAIDLDPSFAHFPTFEFSNNIIVTDVGDKGGPCLLDDSDYITEHRNNLYYRPDGGLIVRNGTGAAFTPNDITDYEPTCVYGDPLLKAPSTVPDGFVGTAGADIRPATDGFDITADSPAKDAGADLGTPFDMGINSVPRPGGAGWDIGAYEHNDAPVVSGLGVSRQALYRTEELTVHATGTDTEDAPAELTPEFEYLDPGEKLWMTAYLSGPVFTGSRWEASFAPPANASLGEYDLRVRFTDTGSSYGEWSYLDEPVEVLNNPPVPSDIALSAHEAVRGDDIVVWVNGTDIEDAEENMTMELEHKGPDPYTWASGYFLAGAHFGDKWGSTLSLPFDAPRGPYDIRARFTDEDGGVSQWLYANGSLEVQNVNPGVVDISPLDRSLYRTESTSVFVNGTDLETSEPDLAFFAECKHSDDTGWKALDGDFTPSRYLWEFEFVTGPESPLGTYDLRARFEDDLNATSAWEYLNGSIEVRNNAPAVVDVEVFTTSVLRTDAVRIDVNAADVETPEALLTVAMSCRPSSGVWKALGGQLYDDDHWSCEFTPPADAALGDYDIMVGVTDIDGGASEQTALQELFSVENNPPVISPLLDEFPVGLTPLTVDLTPFGSDVEDDPDELLWNLDEGSIDASLFSAEIPATMPGTLRMVPVGNVTGSDIISLTLADTDGGMAVRTNVTVHVNSELGSYYSVSISSSIDTVEVAPGDAFSLTLNVTNLGSMADTYTLTYDAGGLSGLSLSLDGEEFGLAPEGGLSMNGTMVVPDTAGEGSYAVAFNVESAHAQDRVSASIVVVHKDPAVEDLVEKKEDAGSSTGVVAACVGAVIASVVTAIIMMFLIRKRKKGEVERGEEPKEMEPITPEPIFIPGKTKEEGGEDTTMR